MTVRFNYGGGRQTVAMCILIAKGVLPRPDVIVMADTGRENPSTWEYLDEFTQPLMKQHGMRIDVAPHTLATVDLHGHQGHLLLPVWTNTGKMQAYCSGEWKRDVCERFVRDRYGVNSGTLWLGLAFDEKRRWSRSKGTTRHGWTIDCPLVELMLNTDACLQIIRDYGWPQPRVSSCWMCPHKTNGDWRYVRDEHPELFEEACKIDEEERDADEMGGVWLHHSKVPLRQACLDTEEKRTEVQCTLGMCFV